MCLEGTTPQHDSEVINEALKNFAINFQSFQNSIVLLAKSKGGETLCNRDPVATTMRCAEEDD
jgi:hypothetical protein